MYDIDISWGNSYLDTWPTLKKQASNKRLYKFSLNTILWILNTFIDTPSLIYRRYAPLIFSKGMQRIKRFRNGPQIIKGPYFQCRAIRGSSETRTTTNDVPS